MADTQGSKMRPKTKPGQPAGKSQFEIFEDVGRVKNNRVAVGTVLAGDSGDETNHAMGSEVHRWLAEHLTGLNVHVKYLHTKYLLLDALTDTPTVISGSANFSTASTVNNDENMLVIQGDTEVADVYLGEFMRLFQHFQFRDVANLHAAQRRGADPEVSPHLVPDDSWTKRAFASARPWS